MASNETTMTDIQTRLAGTTVPCPHCDGLPHIIPGMDRGRCPFCHGTGRVLLFPDEVRAPCSTSVILATMDHAYWDCKKCVGRGWTAARDGWEQAAVEAGAEVVRIWYNRSEDDWWCDVRFPKCEGFVAEADTYQEALMLGILRAVQQIPNTVMEPNHE